MGGITKSRLIPIICITLSAPCWLVLVLVLRAVGPGALAAMLALAGAALLLLSEMFRVGRPWRIRIGVVAAFLLGVTLTLLARRVTGLEQARASAPAAAVRLCENGDCLATPPLLSRLATEEETALTGLYFSQTLFFIGGDEMPALERLLRVGYQALGRDPRFQGLPSAPFIGADVSTLRYLQWAPPHLKKAPCVIFLHGFGGQLTLYLQALIDGGLGDEFVILAPFLDATGAWWGESGEAVVSTLMRRYLPASADPDRVFLVGLSNGAVGASVLAGASEVGRRIDGAALISGIGPVWMKQEQSPELLVVAGDHDPRFPFDHVLQEASGWAERGARVATHKVDGDHFIILSHRHEVAGAIRDWVHALDSRSK